MANATLMFFYSYCELGTFPKKNVLHFEVKEIDRVSRFSHKGVIKMEKLFFCDFVIFEGSTGCETKFRDNEIHYFSSIPVRLKGMAFFLKNLPKLNILSVMAID